MDQDAEEDDEQDDLQDVDGEDAQDPDGAGESDWIGILWRLSSANLLPPALPHIARSET